MKLDYKKQKDGTYSYDHYVAGKRCHIRAKTVAELTTKYNKWVAETAFSNQDEELGPTFEDVLNEWWNDIVHHIKPKTIPGYKASKEFWKQELGRRRIKDIDTHDIVNGLSRLKARGYTTKTIGNYKIVASDIFVYWIQSKWRGDKNPVQYAKLPKGKASTLREPPTEEQIEKVKQHPEGFGIVAWLFMYTGCRLGEVNSLQVKDIHLEEECFGVKGCFDIYEAAPWDGNQPLEHFTTKTETSIRKVPIFGPLRPVLLKTIENLNEDDYIISGTNKPLTQSQYNARWNSYCHELDMARMVEEPLIKGNKTYTRRRWKADITAHQYRHYFATICYEAEMPIMVTQKLLGHKDRATTEKIYTHIRERMMKENATKLDAFFSA